MSKIFGGKCKVYLNGNLIGEFSNIDISKPKNLDKIVEITPYNSKPLPRHICQDCKEEWNFSTNDNECLSCGSENIEHKL